MALTSSKASRSHASALTACRIPSAQLGADTSTDDAEAVNADDATHGFLRPGRFFIVNAIILTAQAFVACARAHALELNFGPGKTEAVLSLLGQGARALRLDIEACGGIQAGDVLIRLVAA